MSRHGQDRPDRGSATVLALGVLGVLMTMALAAFMIASVSSAAHQARSAADLSAVAAAQVLLVGGSPTAACDRAREVAHRNGGELSSCTVHPAGPGAARLTGPRVSVTAERSTQVGLWPRVLVDAEAGLVPKRP